jgi:hypothetical protein
VPVGLKVGEGMGNFVGCDVQPLVGRGVEVVVE